MNTIIISGRLVRNPGYNEVENEKGLHKIAKFVLAVRRNGGNIGNTNDKRGQGRRHDPPAP